VVSCGGDEDGDATIPTITDPTTPTPEPDPDPVDDVPVGDVEPTGFWVNFISDQYTALVNKRGEYGADCFIDSETTSNERVLCDVDLMEGDLNIYDLEMQYNVPPSLCDHLRITPAWHYNFESGRGPARVEIVQDNLSDPAVASSCDAFHTANGALTTCALHPETFDETIISGPKCIYNRADTGGANCCFGKYNLQVELDENNDGVGDGTFVTQTLDWGGDATACISPYLSNAWGFFSPAGFPARSLTAVPKDPDSLNPIGLNDSIVLSSNLQSSNVILSTWANFYNETGTPHQHNGFWYDGTPPLNDNIQSDRPYWVDPIDDLDGSLISADRRLTSAIPAGNEAWVFSCLDSAFEVKHEIHVYIREWNTLVDFVAYQASEGVTYDPDVGGLSGTEGTTCNYDPAFPEELCNDRWDFADILERVEANTTNAYPSTTLGIDEANRQLYFPRIDYE
jgi:hypothetical protein